MGLATWLLLSHICCAELKICMLVIPKKKAHSTRITSDLLMWCSYIFLTHFYFLNNTNTTYTVTQLSAFHKTLFEQTQVPHSFALLPSIHNSQLQQVGFSLMFRTDFAPSPRPKTVPLKFFQSLFSSISPLVLLRMATSVLSGPLSNLAKSPTEMPKPLPEFICFLKLPIELRLEIWSLTMLPRIVDIYIQRIGCVDSIDWPIIELYSTAAVPALLHVCRESRTEAKRTYKLCFGTHLITAEEKHGMFSFVRSPRTYFSYEMDTAHFQYVGTHLERRLPVAYMTEHDLRNVRHIRTDWCEHVSEGLLRQLRDFSSLESIALSWFWLARLDDSKHDEWLQDTVEVTEADWRSLSDRPDISQFMDSLVTARDVFAPGMKLPRLKVTSLNNRQMMDNMLSTFFGSPSRSRRSRGAARDR